MKLKPASQPGVEQAERGLLVGRPARKTLPPKVIVEGLQARVAQRCGRRCRHGGDSCSVQKNLPAGRPIEGGQNSAAMATKQATENYGEDSIRVLKGLEPVKQRPWPYTPPTTRMHIVQEVIETRGRSARRIRQAHRR